MVGYKLQRGDCGGWMFCGTTLEGLINTLKCELAEDFKLPVDERDEITLVPFEISQAEIDNMPEFPGW